MTVSVPDDETIKAIAGVEAPQVEADDEAKPLEEEEIKEPEAGTQPEGDEPVEPKPEEPEEPEEEDDPHLINFRRNDEDKEWELKYGEDGRLDEDTITGIRTMLEKEGLEVTAQRAVEAEQNTARQLEAERARVETLNRDLSSAEVGAKRWDELKKDPQALTLYNRFLQQSKRPPVDPAKDRLEAEVATQRRELDEARYYQAFQQAQTFVAGVAEEFMAKYPDITPELCNEIGDHMGKLGVQLDYSRPLEEQRERMLDALTSGRNIFIGEGRIESQKVVKANEERAETQRKLDASRKRQAVRNPSAGGGKSSSKGKGKTRDSLRGISTAEFVRRDMEAQEQT